VNRYSPPELLAARHQLTGFSCRSEEQSAWLAEMAKQAHGTGTTRVFVVAEIDQPASRGAGRYPQPVALLLLLKDIRRTLSGLQPC
jgi:hypothetical protein